MPGPCSAFQSVNNFGNRFYQKEKSKAWPLLFSIESVNKVVNRLKRTTWTRQETREMEKSFTSFVLGDSNKELDSK